MIWLFLAFTVIPAVELFLLLQLGSLIGPLQTFLLVVVTGSVGAWLAKREGLGVLGQLREELQGGLPPGSRLAEGVLVFIGGTLLITPGVLTDLAGFAFIFPVTRRWLAPRLTNALLSRVDVQIGGGSPGAPGPSRRPSAPSEAHPTPFSSPFDDLP